jgi:hypothetical protein
MSETDFLIFTGIAGVTLGYALLWVLTQFLKTDSEAEVLEKEMQSSIEQLERAQRSTPEPETAVSEEDALAAEETHIARMLFGWGTLAWLVGMVGGAITYGLGGAFIGAIVGSTAGAIGVVTTIVVRNRLAEAAAERAAEAAAEAAAAEPIEAEATDAPGSELAPKRI